MRRYFRTDKELSLLKIVLLSIDFRAPMVIYFSLITITLALKLLGRLFLPAQLPIGDLFEIHDEE